MRLHDFSSRRLIGAASIACAVALAPAAALAAATSPGAPGGAGQLASVPAGFQPISAGFYSPVAGFVLGGVGCAGGPACRARLAATTDSSARWHFVTAPDVLLFNEGGDLLNQASSVRGVVFASRRDGWLYGPGLYATHDGDAHWRRISLGGNIRPALGGGIVTMAVSAGTAWAVVSPDPFEGKPDELYRSPVGQDAWARVGAITGGALAVSGTGAWFGTSTHLWATADGVHWHQYPFACPGAYDGLQAIAAASPSRVVFLCTGDAGMGHEDKEELASADGGRTEHLVGRPPSGGIGGGLAVPPGRPDVITLVAGEYFVYRSADGGKTWKVIAFSAGGATWNSLSYQSETAGWAVQDYTSAGPGAALLRTSDAGATWHQVSF